MKGNKNKEKDKNNSVRYIVLVIVCIIGLLAIQGLYMITSYTPEMNDSDAEIVTAEAASSLDEYAADIAQDCTEKIASCKILSDLDKDQFKTKLNQCIADNINITYKIGDIDRKNKLTVVTFEVQLLNLDGYSNKVVDSVKNDIVSVLSSEVLEDTSSIFEDIISDENSSDVDTSDIVSEIPENESELNTNKYLEEPLDSVDTVGSNNLTYEVEFTYNKDSKTWEASSEDLENMIKQSENSMSSEVYSEIDKLIEYADQLNVLDTVDLDTYSSILNDAINKKLDTVDDIDYTPYIRSYLEKYTEEELDVQ